MISQIFVKPLGRTLVYDVNPNTTINSVKSFILDRLCIPINKQVLYYGGKRLENTNRLQDYDIKNESTLLFNCIEPTRGGGKGVTKGNKNSRKKKKKNTNTTRELEFKTELQEYGKVSKILGNNRVYVNCYDGKKRLGIIRGKMRKRVWIQEGDTVLVSLRGFQDEKCDITFKYTDVEVRNLIIYGEIPDVNILQSDKLGISLTSADTCSFDITTEVE